LIFYTTLVESSWHRPTLCLTSWINVLPSMTWFSKSALQFKFSCQIAYGFLISSTCIKYFAFPDS
jgi:hypothetical protein